MCPKYRSDTQEIEIGLAGDIDPAAQFSIFEEKCEYTACICGNPFGKASILYFSKTAVVSL